MFTTRFALATAILLFSWPAHAGRVAKEAICHWDADAAEYHVISVAPRGAEAHRRQHGDSPPAAYWPDADGDGHGAPGAIQDVCPQTGMVDNAGDCDDSDAGVNPGAEEVCDDGIDNDCDGEIDEGCAVAGACPCYSESELQDAYERHLSNLGSYPANQSFCYAYGSQDGYSDAGLYFYRYRYDYPEFEYAISQFQSSGGDRDSSCTVRELDYTFDYLTFLYDWRRQEQRHLAITATQRQACEDLVLDWAAEAGLTCDIGSW